jgi:hypothetical protein
MKRIDELLPAAWLKARGQAAAPAAPSSVIV